MTTTTRRMLLKLSLGVLVFLFVVASAVFVIAVSGTDPTGLLIAEKDFKPLMRTMPSANTSLRLMPNLNLTSPHLQVVAIEQEDTEDEEEEDETEEDEPVVSSARAKITLQKAQQIAITQFGGRVSGSDTDRLHGRDVWEIEITTNGKQGDVLIDMETGSVVRVEWEEGDDD